MDMLFFFIVSCSTLGLPSRHFGMDKRKRMLQQSHRQNTPESWIEAVLFAHTTESFCFWFYFRGVCATNSPSLRLWELREAARCIVVESLDGRPKFIYISLTWYIVFYPFSFLFVYLGTSYYTVRRVVTTQYSVFNLSRNKVFRLFARLVSMTVWLINPEPGGYDSRAFALVWVRFYVFCTGATQERWHCLRFKCVVVFLHIFGWKRRARKPLHRVIYFFLRRIEIKRCFSSSVLCPRWWECGCQGEDIFCYYILWDLFF